jgi:hypothetical protein
MVACAAGMAIVPIQDPQALTLAPPHQYVLFGVVNDAITANRPAFLFLFFAFVAVGDYWAVNLKRFLEPRRRDVLKAMAQASRIHLEVGELAARVQDLAAAKPSAADERNAADSAILKMLAAVEGLLGSYMDTVSKSDRVTSNVMIAIDPRGMGAAEREALEKQLLVERLYSGDNCELADCIAWLRLSVRSAATTEEYDLKDIAFRIHRTPTRCIPGAGLAYHWGRHYLAGTAAYRFAAVNDVFRIEFPAGLGDKAQAEAKAHFEELGGKIRSFASLPLSVGDGVVGVHNVNSSGYFLAGYTQQQRSVFESLVFPALRDLASVVCSLRRGTHGFE